MFVTPGYAQEGAPAQNGGHEGVAAGAAHTQDQGGHDVFPPFDTALFPSQLLWLVISFALLYLFLKRIVVPRIGGILEVRRDRIAQDLDQAAKMKEEADEAVAAYEQELAEARNSANAIGQQARDEAKADAEAERRKIEAELDARLAEAEKRIAAIRDAAMKDVGTIAEETTAAIVEQLVGSGSSKAEIAAAVRAAARA